MRHSKRVGVVFSAVVFLMCFVTAATAANGSVRYEPYESHNPAFGLLKPANGAYAPRRRADSMAIAVSNPTGTRWCRPSSANSMHADAWQR